MLTLHLLLQDCKESIFLCISRCFDCQLSLFGQGNPTIQVALIVTTDSCWLVSSFFIPLLHIYLPNEIMEHVLGSSYVSAEILAIVLDPGAMVATRPVKEQYQCSS
ncbi:hypothetical protein F2Q69_00040451 [Brassica cretica]|uniref:Uncharacterized protein n=1 Tax=Brassica cretica TaxID=69181 RepID=A0A8S9N690_BRACR|nr:hypothetical protein F2Q69_00040451 [Brassica cretica]